MQTTHGDKFTIQTMYCLCRNYPNKVLFGTWSNNHDFRTLHMTINRDNKDYFRKILRFLISKS